MKPTHIIVLILLAVGCKEDEVIIAPPTMVVVGSVNVTAMPFLDLHGLPWDPDGGPDVFIIVYDKHSNILSQTRGTPAGNVTASMIPLRLGVNASLAIDSDSCYLALWDRDDDAGDPDDLIGSTDTWISTSKLRQAGSPGSIEMKNASGEMRIIVSLLYQ
jgi:hypothetical protein